MKACGARKKYLFVMALFAVLSCAGLLYVNKEGPFGKLLQRKSSHHGDMEKSKKTCDEKKSHSYGKMQTKSNCNSLKSQDLSLRLDASSCFKRKDRNSFIALSHCFPICHDQECRWAEVHRLNYNADLHLRLHR